LFNLRLRQQKRCDEEDGVLTAVASAGMSGAGASSRGMAADDMERGLSGSLHLVPQSEDAQADMTGQ
jgi:hypothetical protein